MVDNPRPAPAPPNGISLTKDPRRARLSRQLRRLHRAFERAPHPSWLATETAPRLVGTYVFDNMTLADRAALSRNMLACSEDNAELNNEWYRDLGNLGVGVGCQEPPTDDEMRDVLERLAAVRTEPHCDLWASILSGLSEGGKGDDARIGALFEMASGISDDVLFGGARFGGPQTPGEEALVREAVGKLNTRRDVNLRHGYAFPKAHADLELFYPEPGRKLSHEQELQRLDEALDLMPHPSWQEDDENPRLVGDYIFSRLTPGERAKLAESMTRASTYHPEPSFWHDTLGNARLSTGMGLDEVPGVDDMCEFIEDLAEYRTDDIYDRWPHVLDGMCMVKGQYTHLLALFEEASGISEEFLFGPHVSLAEEEAASQAVEALNRRRDELLKAGQRVPRAHINWAMFYPRPEQPPIPTLGMHRRPPRI
jgi:hypothetical protein